MAKVVVRGCFERKGNLRMEVECTTAEETKSFSVSGINAYALLMSIVFVLSDYNVFSSDMYTGSRRSFYFEFEASESLYDVLQGIAKAPIEAKNSMLSWSSDLSMQRLREIHALLLNHFIKKYGAVIE